MTASNFYVYRIDPCPTCKGSGNLPRRGDPYRLNNSPEINCLSCNGTGQAAPVAVPLQEALKTLEEASKK